MRAVVQPDLITRQVKVWLYDDGPDGTRIYSPDGLEVRTLPYGTERGEPSLMIHKEALKALIGASTDSFPASDATTAHLKDAIGVRDRLLSLVERVP